MFSEKTRCVPCVVSLQTLLVDSIVQTIEWEPEYARLKLMTEDLQPLTLSKEMVCQLSLEILKKILEMFCEEHMLSKL